MHNQALLRVVGQTTANSGVDRGIAATKRNSIDADDRESARLNALDRYDILDTKREESFDRISRLAKKLIGVPVAMLSFFDAHRQWYKSCAGVEAVEAPREQVFCNHVIASGKPVVVPDTTKDPRFAQHPFVVDEPKLRFYMSVPLTTGEGDSIGSLCVVDTEPREVEADCVEVLADLAQMAMDELELRRQASTDSLTGAMSRRAFKEEAAREVALATRHRHALSCIIFDLDHFKSVNDTHGHAGGDLALAATIRTCAHLLRDTDRVGRLGGEEFGVLLPMTDGAAAMDIAEMLRAEIEGVEIDAGSGPFSVTSSFGVAELGSGADNIESLLRDADDALYKAKAGGRNRCVAYRAAGNRLVVSRRRVLKGGQLYFDGRLSPVTCTVRSLSDQSAGIDVCDSAGVPDSFSLRIKSDRLEKECQVIARTEKQLEVAFA